MNAEMIAKRHWKWPTNAFEAANRDAASRDPQNAVSRAYYAMMHGANAALATKGLQAKTHNGTQTLFNEHLVQPGEVDRQRGRELASGQRRRTSADYDVSRHVSESEPYEQCTGASRRLTVRRRRARSRTAFGIGSRRRDAVELATRASDPSGWTSRLVVARVAEGAGAVLAFAATLSRAATSAFTVDYATEVRQCAGR